MGKKGLKKSIVQVMVAINQLNIRTEAARKLLADHEQMINELLDSVGEAFAVINHQNTLIDQLRNVVPQKAGDRIKRPVGRPKK